MLNGLGFGFNTNKIKIEYQQEAIIYLLLNFYTAMNCIGSFFYVAHIMRRENLNVGNGIT